jgi:hypothetical protein
MTFIFFAQMMGECALIISRSSFGEPRMLPAMLPD